jgi:hypothetical protein
MTYAAYQMLALKAHLRSSLALVNASATKSFHLPRQPKSAWPDYKSKDRATSGNANLVLLNIPAMSRMATGAALWQM